MTMQPRLEVLQRLVTLYGVVEEMHSTELRRMTAVVRETQQSIGVEQELRGAARKDGHAALHTGDRMSWAVAETQQEAAAWRGDRLEQMRREQILLRDAAMEQYVASRLKKEQMKRARDDIAQGVEIEKGRRTQAASDDRFLARRRWTDAQEVRRFEKMRSY